VFFACHSDQALRMLSDPTELERSVLGAFPYAANRAYLHTDARLLPRVPLARAAWNYHLLAKAQQPVAITYDMNVLQALHAPVRFLVTLNHARAIDERKILHEVQYHHPVYLPSGVQAQRRHREVNGVCRTYYSGAYWRYGFHEDGVVSAMQALEHFEADHAQAAEPQASDAKLSLQRVG
jgi:predicted NAD/FAD-binding protein